jgi:hypothetical protein
MLEFLKLKKISTDNIVNMIILGKSERFLKNHQSVPENMMTRSVIKPILEDRRTTATAKRIMKKTRTHSDLNGNESLSNMR